MDKAKQDESAAGKGTRAGAPSAHKDSPARLGKLGSKGVREKMQLIATAREVLPFLEREGVRSVRPLLNALGEGVLVADGNQDAVFANRAAQALLGCEDDRLDLADAFADESVQGIYEAASCGDVISTDRAILTHANGKQVHVLLTAIPVFEANEVAKVIFVFRDITPTRLMQMSPKQKGRVHDQSQLETALAINHEINALLTQLLTERGAGDTLETALRGAIELCRADCGLIGLYDSQEYTVTYRHSTGFAQKLPRMEYPLEKTPVGRMFVDRKPIMLDNYPAYPLALAEVVEAGAQVYLGAPLIGEDDLLGVVSLFRLTDDPFGEEERGILLTLVPVLSAAILKARYEYQLQLLATRDSLTGLWNRRVVFETLDEEVARANRYGDTFSAIILDLDHFKDFNDHFGHLAGDEVLRSAAEVMRKQFRTTDRIGRTGGEEFMVILPRTNLAEAVNSAERFRQDLESTSVAFNEHSLRCTASLGCAEYRLGETKNQFFARLDGLLYRAKDQGRNRTVSG